MILILGLRYAHYMHMLYAYYEGKKKPSANKPVKCGRCDFVGIAAAGGGL